MASGPGILSRLRNLRVRLLRRQEDDQTREMADFLGTIPLFAPLNRAMLVELAEAVHERAYRRDEFVYFEGDPGIGLYVVRSGQVRLLVEGPDAEHREIRTVGEGEIVGYTGVLGEGMLRRSESVQATTETRLVGVFSPDFRTLQRRQPKTGAVLAGLLARHFALVQSETRRLLGEGSDPVGAATALSEAERRAASRLADLHGG